MNELPQTPRFDPLHTIFDAVEWRERVEEQISACRAFLKFILDESAVAAHEQTIAKEVELKLQTSPILKSLLGSAEKIDNSNPFVQVRSTAVYRSFEIYSRQSVVVLASFLEGVIANFFYCVFCKHPNRMYNFINPGANQSIIGKIDINRVLSAHSIEDLLFELASEASENASSGDYKSVLKRLVEISKGTVTKNDANKTLQIIEIRNRIVHELSEEKIDLPLLDTCFSSVIEFITHLEIAARKMEVPIFVFDGE